MTTGYNIAIGREHLFRRFGRAKYPHDLFSRDMNPGPKTRVFQRSIESRRWRRDKMNIRQATVCVLSMNMKLTQKDG